MNEQTTIVYKQLAIETEKHTRRFGTIVAVDEVNLAVPYGDIFGLLGPNGAGKTTMIKMLTTLLDPSLGSARVAGFDTRSLAGSEASPSAS